MIIGVDAGCLGLQDKRLQVGVYQVAVHLLQELSRRDTHNTYYLYSFDPIEKDVMTSFGPRMKNIVVRPARGWMKVWLPLQLMKDKPEVFLALSQAAPQKLPFSTDMKVVGLVHDVAFKRYPQLYPTYVKHDKDMQHLVAVADALIAVSEATKEDLMAFYHADERKVHVAYEGVREFPHPSKGESEKPFFLFAGALKKQKNIPGLIRSFDVFLQTTGSDVDLRIVGGDKWLDTGIEEMLQNIQPNTLEHIIFEKHVEDARLAHLYSAAIAFVSPSLYEGFGLPFVEAMSFGCPVIGSTEGALSEVVGRGGVLVSALDYQKLAEAMAEVYSNPALRNKLASEAKAQVKKYSWEQFAKTIFSIISSV